MNDEMLVKSYMLWMSHLGDRLKMKLAMALLGSIEIKQPEDSNDNMSEYVGKWEGESAEELIDIVYGGRNSNLLTNE